MEQTPCANDYGWLNDLFRNSPDAIVIQSHDGRILDANLAMSRLTGLPLAVLTGKAMEELLANAYRPAWKHDFEMLASGKWNMLETAIIDARNEHATPVVATMISRSQRRQQTVIIIHFHDSSIYHTVEKALMASQAQWEMSFDAITDCMCILDHEGRILRVNRAMSHRFNPHVQGGLCNRNFSEVLRPADGPDKTPLPHPVRNAPFVLGKTAFQDIAGWFSATAYPLRNQEQTLLGGVLILHDITAQLHTEEALQKSQNALRQAAKMEAVGRLAGGIAHDFNNMLTSVLGYSSMIAKKVPPESDISGEIEEIMHAAERAAALTRQLLNFSHERAIETQVININSVITNLSKFIRHTIGETVALSLDLSPELAPVQADVCRLEQILVNLAINARDAMPGGGKLIIETADFTASSKFCESHPQILPGDYVLLQVSDTGQGMPPHVLEHIFEPFFTTKPRGKGTGLGLTTIYGIVKQFGGFILCYSEVNQGTTFKIYLPQSAAHQPATEIKTETAEFPGGAETILVVDDEEYIVKLINQILTKLGYTVLATTSCREAQEICGNDRRIDLVLTDIVMPEMHGMALLKQLRLCQPQVKAVLMSGYTSNAAMQIEKLPENIAFLQKPFNLESLAKSVRKALAAK